MECLGYLVLPMVKIFRSKANRIEALTSTFLRRPSDRGPSGPMALGCPTRAGPGVREVLRTARTFRADPMDAGDENMLVCLSFLFLVQNSIVA